MNEPVLRLARDGIRVPQPGQQVLDDLHARGDVHAAVLVARSFPATLRSPSAHRLAGRACLVLGDWDGCLGFTRLMRDGGDVLWEPLEGYARAQQGFAVGRDQLNRALASLDCEVVAEAAYRLALLAWADGRGADALPLVEQTHATATGRGLCLLQMMQGWIEVQRLRYPAAARCFRAALETYQQAGVRDEWQRQRLLQAASVIGMETLDLGVLRGIDCEHGDLGHEAREPAFFATQNRGWLALLCGDQLGALGLFQSARALAGTPALIATAEVNIATYHRLRGAQQAARDHLELARVHLRSQTWKTANADERIALLEYAVEAYLLDPFTAGEMLTRYQSIELRKLSRLAFERDPRVGAVEALASGVLEAIQGRVASAQALLERSASAWHALGYSLKEATTNLVLHRVTGESRYLDQARRIGRAVPQSWLARDAEVAPAPRSEGAVLGVAQKRVMRAICEGKTSREIAQQFGKSVHTVRNQTLSIYRAMNVHTRSALVAECARLGLLTGPGEQPSAHRADRLRPERLRA